MSDILFRASGGGDPVHYVLDLTGALEVRASDLRYAAERQRSRILERTAKGLDVDDKPFAPYSTAGPYYHYPARGPARGKAAAARLFRQITRNQPKSETTNTWRTGTGLRFASYADFKRSLGRSTVDLTGPRAPHMLQALIVSDVTDSEFRLGVYGAEEAARGSGHNAGTRRLPRRHWFGMSAADVADAANDLAGRIDRRVRGKT